MTETAICEGADDVADYQFLFEDSDFGLKWRDVLFQIADLTGVIQAARTIVTQTALRTVSMVVGRGPNHVEVRMSPKAPFLRRVENHRQKEFKASDFFKPRTPTTSNPQNQGLRRTPNQSEPPPTNNAIVRSKRKLDAKRPAIPSTSAYLDEVILSDASDTDCMPSSSSAKKIAKASSTVGGGRAVNDCDGTKFDFSADPKVRSLQNALVNLVDPDGKQNRSELESYVAGASARCIEKQDVNPRHSWRQKKTNGTAGAALASFDDFRCANGKPVERGGPMRRVVGEESDSAGSGGSSTSNGHVGQGATTKYLGSRPIRATFKPPSRTNSLNSAGGGGGGGATGASGKTASALFDAALNAAKGTPTGLAAEPSLKHFDANIVALIESEIMSLNGTTEWSDVAGLEGAKRVLKEIVVWPFLRPDIFKGIRAPPKGVLLFGPPGTGKTMIGRCVASQCKATFFNISASSLTSKWVGEGEKLVRALFAVARLKLPSVIFIDEIDSLLSARSESEHESSRRIKTEFLVQLDGVATTADERLLVLGATNRPYELDEAARRRFAKRLYVGLPESEARVAIVKRSLEHVDHAMGAEEYERIADLTKGYSGADMHQLCAEAAMGPVREALAEDIESVDAASIRPIGAEDLVKAAKVVRATVVEKDLKAYAEWDKTFGCLL